MLEPNVDHTTKYHSKIRTKSRNQHIIDLSFHHLSLISPIIHHQIRFNAVANQNIT